MKRLGPRETRALLERHGLRAKTGIGQHFVTDANTVRRVVEISGIKPGDQVVEIGPGLGALSLALLEAGARLIAIERDRALSPVLEEVLAGYDVILVWGDAMKVRYDELLGNRESVLVSNLPYQIATPLLLDLLVGYPLLRSYSVMVQKEVGERLVAVPGENAYGAVSVKVAALADAGIAMKVSRRVFFPPPDVESVVVRIDRREPAIAEADRRHLFRVIDAGFAQRRKTIRRALASGGWSAEEIERALEQADIAGQARAETLELARFAALARSLPRAGGTV